MDGWLRYFVCCVGVYASFCEASISDTTHSSTACYRAGINNVTNATCETNQRIAILEACYTSDTQCASSTNSSSECDTRYNHTEIQALLMTCSAKTRCTFPPWLNGNWSVSMVKYTCIEDTDIISMNGSQVQNKTEVTLQYTSQDSVITRNASVYTCAVNFTTRSAIHISSLDLRLGTQGECDGNLIIENRDLNLTCGCTFEDELCPRYNTTTSTQVIITLFLENRSESSSFEVVSWLWISSSASFDIKCETGFPQIGEDATTAATDTTNDGHSVVTTGKGGFSDDTTSANGSSEFASRADGLSEPTTDADGPSTSSVLTTSTAGLDGTTSANGGSVYTSTTDGFTDPTEGPFTSGVDTNVDDTTPDGRSDVTPSITVKYKASTTPAEEDTTERPSSEMNPEDSSTPGIVGGVVASSIITAIASLALICYIRRRKLKVHSKEHDIPLGMKHPPGYSLAGCIDQDILKESGESKMDSQEHTYGYSTMDDKSGRLEPLTGASAFRNDYDHIRGNKTAQDTAGDHGCDNPSSHTNVYDHIIEKASPHVTAFDCGSPSNQTGVYDHIRQDRTAQDTAGDHGCNNPSDQTSVYDHIRGNTSVRVIVCDHDCQDQSRHSNLYDHMGEKTSPRVSDRDCRNPSDQTSVYDHIRRDRTAQDTACDHDMDSPSNQTSVYYHIPGNTSARFSAGDHECNNPSSHNNLYDHISETTSTHVTVSDPDCGNPSNQTSVYDHMCSGHCLRS